MKKIAIIGCGIMGSGIVRNFLAKDFTVYIWNRTKDKTAGLISEGAIWVETPKEAAEKADVIFEVTANDQSSKSVWHGESGILAGSTEEKYLIASATLSIPWIDGLALECKGKRLRFFDVPLTGGRSGAETGQLILLAGGDKKGIDELGDLFKAISKQVIYFGKVGSGIRYKLILNMLQAVQIVGFGEALRLARKYDLDLNIVGESLKEKPGGTATLNAWNGFKTNSEQLTFAIDWITKDLSYAKEAATNIETPLLDDVLKAYKKAQQEGKGGLDWTAVNLK